MTLFMLGDVAHDMGGWGWFLMSLMTVFWLVVAAAAVYIAIMLRREGRIER